MLISIESNLDQVDVMEVVPPTWNIEVFDLLAFEEFKKKELIKVLVERHIADSSERSTFNDFIPGRCIALQPS